MGEMDKIDAMDIYEQVKESKWCEKAYKFYNSRHYDKDRILKRGGANFDEKLESSDKEEEEWYRAAYYVGYGGYMDMHIRHNRSVFEEYLPPDVIHNKNCLFVDLGCGPMTSGLVFAEKLSEVMPDYRQWVTYIGVDCSQNMCKIAKEVNKKYLIFNSFYIEKEYIFKKEMLPEDLTDIDIAVLCLSFVLAPDTCKIPKEKQEAYVKELVNKWCEAIIYLEKCMETRIIYMNPSGNFHPNWYNMISRFKFKNCSMALYYGHFNESEPLIKEVPGLENPVFMQMVKGRRG